MSEEKKESKKPLDAPIQGAGDRSAPTGEPAKAEEQVRKSPREWALELGHGPQKPKHEWSGPAAVMGMSRQHGSMAYEVAAVLHGWREHEHHENAPMLLTKEEFEAALEAAFPESGNPKPHAPALSKHRGGLVRRHVVNGSLVEFRHEGQVK